MCVLSLGSCKFGLWLSSWPGFISILSSGSFLNSVIMFQDIVLTFVKITVPALLLVLAFSVAFYMMFFVPSPMFAVC